MTTYLVTRHSGALDWLRAQGFTDVVPVPHLDPAQVTAGDSVVGTLPVHLAAEICARGGRYYHLSLDLPPQARGRELSAADLDRYAARVEQYRVHAAAGTAVPEALL
ncbi:MAG: CRISPR-associated protein Csx16 [Xanthomonadaceae bacterium]|nr:CRISPR-associated protein Csx16 [Xanthomonadaceae bacterium]MDP2185418.1 CRISPR-associated protein Csx16 [Xanthomonadales bacterium]MDZ4116816.1 CRISPR-associated protein Csx16 [Xanthomonadaceae bacterium]MDZ4379201.1 CRISPR-associated protein Csx16 [Xanthomonadaceae bacterium]